MAAPCTVNTLVASIPLVQILATTKPNHCRYSVPLLSVYQVPWAKMSFQVLSKADATPMYATQIAASPSPLVPTPSNVYQTRRV